MENEITPAWLAYQISMLNEDEQEAIKGYQHLLATVKDDPGAKVKYANVIGILEEIIGDEVNHSLRLTILFQKMTGILASGDGIDLGHLKTRKEGA